MSKKNDKKAENTALALSASMAAIVLSVGLVGAKAWVWVLGGSAAMLASMVDSFVDAALSLSNYLAIKYAHRPADHDHRFGHGKAEGLAALGQSTFIAGSCVFVVLESLRRLSNPTPVGAIDAGIWVLVVATLLTIALTRYQSYVVRRSGSLAVEANSANYTGDAAFNVGIIISFLAARYLGWVWLDPLVGIGVACWLLYTAWHIGSKAVHMLLDHELDDQTREHILNLIRATPGVEGVHDLRTRASGPHMHISFDIEVDGTLTLAAAHDIAHAVEAHIIKAYPAAEVMIHTDPRGCLEDSRHTTLEAYHAH